MPPENMGEGPCLKHGEDDDGASPNGMKQESVRDLIMAFECRHGPDSSFDRLDRFVCESRPKQLSGERLLPDNFVHGKVWRRQGSASVIERGENFTTLPQTRSRAATEHNILSGRRDATTLFKQASSKLQSIVCRKGRSSTNKGEALQEASPAALDNSAVLGRPCIRSRHRRSKSIGRVVVQNDGKAKLTPEDVAKFNEIRRKQRIRLAKLRRQQLEKKRHELEKQGEKKNSGRSAFAPSFFDPKHLHAGRRDALVAEAKQKRVMTHTANLTRPTISARRRPKSINRRFSKRSQKQQMEPPGRLARIVRMFGPDCTKCRGRLANLFSSRQNGAPLASYGDRGGSSMHLLTTANSREMRMILPAAFEKNKDDRFEHENYFFCRAYNVQEVEGVVTTA